MAKVRRVLLVDGDVLVYRISARHEVNTDWGEGQHTVHADEEAGIQDMDDTLAALKAELRGDDMIVALTCHLTVNFRKTLFPEYKANRKNLRKPLLWKALRDHLFAKYAARIKDNLEADDILGILQTKIGPVTPGGPANVNKIICSVDKDFKTIPGKLYNWDTKEKLVITEQMANYNFMTQVLTGDSTDNYKGLPGCGPVKAAKILVDETSDMRTMWRRIVEQYIKADMANGHNNAVLMARMARILRASDYDFKKKEPILWTPDAQWML